MKQAAKEWIFWFKSDFVFRRTFLLVFYIVMILVRTLLNRNMWANPVSNVIGTWAFIMKKENLQQSALKIWRCLFLFQRSCYGYSGKDY